MGYSIAELMNKEFEVIGTFEHLVYPSRITEQADNTWSVFDLEVLEVKSGHIPDEEGGGPGAVLRLSGYAPKLEDKVRYNVKVKILPHQKYHVQYKVLSMFPRFDPKNREELFAYLGSVLPDEVVKGLRNAEFDVLDAIKHKNMKKLMTIWGVGQKTAQKILDRYENGMVYAYAFANLAQFDLTKDAIKKLVSKYRNNAELAVKAITENPYRLIDDVKGYGWNKADALALRMGFDPDGKERAQAYIKFFLKDQAESNGHSWLELKDLIQNLMVICPKITGEQAHDWIQEMLDNKELYYNKLSAGEGGGADLKRIGLYSLRRIEEEITENLLRLKYAPNWELADLEGAFLEAEEITGYEFTEQQREAVKLISDNKVSIVTAKAGCVDADTEFFDGEKWKKISEWQQGDEVAQIAANSKGEFSMSQMVLSSPKRYVNAKASDMYRLRITYWRKKYEFVVSKDHNMIYLDSDTALWKKMSCKKFLKRIKNGWDFYIPMFNPDGNLPVFHIPVNRDNLEIEPFIPNDGKQYCFTTPTGNWIARRNGTYFVSSNSGKSSTMLPVAIALRHMGKRVAQVALSGKASLNLTEITHQEGQTIHRLLKYKPRMSDSEDNETLDGDGLEKFEVNQQGEKKDDKDAEVKAQNNNSMFQYKKTYQLPYDVVILDEVSMVGGGLFLNLIEAIPDYAKLILIGDEGQLEAIGYCNVLHDLRKSNCIPSIRLTKILRQNAKSGIITDSSKIYEKEQFIPPNFAGTERHGELQDFQIMATADTSQTRAVAVSEYQRILLLPGVTTKNIIIATYKRSIGALSAYALSKDIQQAINPGPTSDEVTLPYHDRGVPASTITFRRKDRVIVTTNHYKIDTDIKWVLSNFGKYEGPAWLWGDLEQMYNKETIESQNELYLTTGRLSDDLDSMSVYNGNLGDVVWTMNILNESGSKVVKKAVCVEFPFGRAVFEADEAGNGTLEDLLLGYAATTHKLQGSGIPFVIAVVDPGAYTLLTNEALYTQITRAKKWCSLIGPVANIRRAVTTTYVRTKKTWLADLIRNNDAAIQKGERVPQVSKYEWTEEYRQEQELAKQTAIGQEIFF